MSLAIEKFDANVDVVFWCGHRVFDEQCTSDVSGNDQIIFLALHVVLAVCPACLIQLAQVVLKSGLFLEGSSDPITLFCGHREWVDGVGQPASGDRSLAIIKNGDAHLVACPTCAERLGLHVAAKALRLKFEEVVILEDLIAAE